MSRTWKSRVIRAAAKVLAVTVTATSCLSGMAFTAKAEGYGKNGIVRDITSQQLVEDMGLGYNIGNTFDSIGSFIEMGDPWDYQKGWGNEPVSQHFIQKIKESGFKTIRLPVSWAQWIDENNQINPGYMQAVQTVVDWCMNEDMYVILNIHHDGGGADTAWIRKAATDWDWTSRRYEAVWTQISENFKHYGDHLIFEGMNEIEFPAAKNMSEQYEILNRMNQLFVDTVRKSGGNNAERHLMIPGYNTDIRWTSDRRYHMPEDPANHSILSIHYYSPSAFCVAERDAGWAVPRTTWGTQEDIAEVEANLNILAENFLSKGVPIIIGEYGVLTEDDKEPSSIQEYLKTVPEIIMQYGMCPVLWDTSNAGDMKFVERVSGEFYDPVIKSNYQQLAQKKASGQIVKKEFYFPEYQRVTVPVTPGGWVSLDAFEPDKIQGIAFELDCVSDWDSYGGGGIYLDGWEDTIQYQFTSVYDEVSHMFTDAEKARLNDQLGVFIWWTDESNGGNRRDELSIKGQKITLLYGENETVNVPRIDSITGGFRSSGGSGGGGGGSRTPNNSTAPSGGSSSGGTKSYQYVLKQSRQNAPEGDNETGVQKLDVQKLCPDYQVGDKIRITVEVMADGGYSFAAQASEGGVWKNSDSWGADSGKSVSWECTPDDGQAAIYLWYLGGSYLMFNVNIEVVEKAKVFVIDDVAGELTHTENENEYAYNLEDVLEAYQIEAGKRVRLTVYPEKTADGEDVSGKIWFVDANGVNVSGDFNTASENGSVSLVGTPKDGNIYFTLNRQQEKSRAAGVPTFRVKNIRVEQLPDADALAELLGISRVEIPSEMVQQSEGEEEGVKVYIEYDGTDISDRGAFSANLVINNDWDFSNDKWEIRTDANGQYIWYPGASNGAVMIACWYSNGDSFRVTKIEQIKDVSNAFSEFIVSKDKPAENYSFAELLEKEGIAAGSRIKLTVSVKAEGKAGGSIVLTEENGTKITGVITGNSDAVVIGNFAEATADFRVNEDSETDAYTVTDIQIEKLDGNAIGEFQKAGRIEFAPELIETKEIEGLETSGLKVYYQYDGEIKGVSSNLVVNGDWSYGNDQWVVGEDDNGTYIWYDCESAGSVLIGCWYINQSWKITGLVHEVKKAGGTDIPDVPDTPELKDNEALAELGDGKYYVPEGKGTPTGMRYTGTGLNGTNISINGNYWGWKAVDEEHAFSEETQVEYLEFFTSEGEEITAVIFIYSDKEPTTPDTPEPPETNENEAEAVFKDGKYYVPEGKENPTGMRYTGTGLANNGTNINVNGNYWGWKEVEKEHLFAEETQVEYLEFFPGEGGEITTVIFIFSDTATTSLMDTIAHSMLYRMLPDVDFSDEEEIFELGVSADEDGNYYLPELSEETAKISVMGIRAKVSSNSKDVTLTFDENEDSRITVKPENKTVYYFFDQDDSVECVAFDGQKVREVTFLFWNGEKADSIEDGVFALPDYRIPAAVQFICGKEEDEEVKLSLSAELYDSRTKAWKEEGKLLTGTLSVKADGTGWYVFTEKDCEVLEDVFAKVKEGHEAPRLRFMTDNEDYPVECVTAYYNLSYTDEMEIIVPDETEIKQVNISKDKDKNKHTKKDSSEESSTVTEPAEKMDKEVSELPEDIQDQKESTEELGQEESTEKPVQEESIEKPDQDESIEEPEQDEEQAAENKETDKPETDLNAEQKKDSEAEESLETEESEEPEESEKEEESEEPKETAKEKLSETEAEEKETSADEDVSASEEE